MKPFNLTITSPDGNVFKSEAVSVFLRGTEGEFAIMAGHTPFVTTVISCECKIELPDGSRKEAHTEGGIITVSNNEVTLLSGSFEWK